MGKRKKEGVKKEIEKNGRILGKKNKKENIIRVKKVREGKNERISKKRKRTKRNKKHIEIMKEFWKKKKIKRVKKK